MNNLLASSSRSVAQGSHCVSLGYLWLISFESIPCESLFKAMFQATFQDVIKNETWRKLGSNFFDFWQFFSNS